MLSRAELEFQFRAMADAHELETQVISDGPLDSHMAFVSEYPGEQEVRHGVPLIGKSGTFLWSKLKRYGITRDTVYTTNVVKHLVGSERDSINQDEFDKWQEMLQWELNQLPNLKIIVVFGGIALAAVTGLNKIMNWRGSVFDHGGYKIVCAHNPAFILREPRQEIIFIMDCQKIDQVNRGVFKEHKIDAIINPSYKETMAYIRDLQRSDNPVSFDIEGLNNETACVGLANSTHRAICINLRDAFRNRYTLSEEYDVWLAIQKLCDSHRIIAQNGAFDAYWTRLHDWLCLRVWFDTLLAHHTMYPQLPHSLGFLTSQYTTHAFYKDEGDYWKEGGNIDEFWTYNCKDAAITYAVYEKELSELKSQQLDKFFFDHVMRAQPHLVEATVHGVAVDLSVKEKIKELVNKDVGLLEQVFYRTVHEATGDDDYYPSPASWQQLKTLMFGRLNLHGHGTSTDATNRQHILKHPKTRSEEKEMIVALNAWKKEDKFRNTYANSRESNDGRFRCDYKQYGVTNAPGRLSSTELLTGEGGNMQNQPVRARGFFVADPGCVLIYFDLAQAEAQVVSFRADIHKWKQQFAQAKKDGKYDCHRALASEMFRIDYASVPTADWDENNRPTMRYVAKRCRHGLNYRMEKWKLSEVTDLPYHQAARAFYLYHKITPELVQWWEAEEHTFRKKKELYNALGRRFRVLQTIDDEVLKSVVAFYPQSTIGDKITQVWYMAEEDDDWPMDSRVCIDVHDNLVALSSLKTAKTALRVLRKHAESPIWIQDAWARRPAEALSIAAECKMSQPSSWNDATKRFEADPKGLHRWSFMEKVHV